MRKVVLYELMSLDGVAEEPGNWLDEDPAAMFDNLGNIIQQQDDILLGRHTYDYWVDYWPTSDVEPFASFINQTPKHVFTSRLLNGEWANTSTVAGSAADYVAQLKRTEGGDIGIHGSISLARSLMADDLVDEMRLVVAAALAGSGERLFDATGRSSRLQLTGADPAPRGSLFLTYQRPD